MLNMHETILAGVPGNEQPQEEVQLTELVPVKQSRFRETSIFKDGDTTDALKVLRSFTGGCNDDGEFGIETFNFTEKIDCEDEEEIKAQQKKTLRRIVGSDSQGSVVERKRKIVRRRSQNNLIQKQIRGSGKRIVEARGLKKAAVKSVKKRNLKNCEEVDEKDEGSEYQQSETSISLEYNEENENEENENEENENEENENEENENEENENEENENEENDFLDLGKAKDLKDEVYIFRHENLDISSSGNANKECLTNLESLDKSNKNCSSMNEELFEDLVLSKEKSSKSVSNNKENEDTSRDNGKNSGLDNTNKELSLNISAIIQANYLFEQENNNLMSMNETNLQETSSSPTSMSTLTEGFSSSSSEESNAKKLRNSSDDQENQEKKYCCVVCDARFKGSGGLRNHYKIVHGAGPVFKCDECGKEFPLKERLKLHVRTHTGFKPYKCPECDKSFARGGQLVQHRRTHSQVKPYRCTLCSGTFTCAANLALHVKRHNGQKDHKCEICGRAFVRRDALKKHLECLHRDVKSFLCVICNKTFKGHLPQHMRTHARDRPHGCATCGQRFAQKSQLTVHQRTHSGQRPFRCLVCWQAFAHSTALKLHTRRHTGERPFKCTECNAGFTQLPHWKKHMKCIHGRNEPYGCKRCKSFFRIKNDLESHEKTCHPEGEGNIEGTNPVDPLSNENTEKNTPSTKYRVMTVERMRLLLAVLLKRISRQERLDELGFGKRLIDEVLQDSLISAGKDPVTGEGLSELEALTKNLEIFLEWTVPKEHWENFRRLKKTPEDILETLTAT